MNSSDSRFAYFQLYNGTEIHLPRSVLELAAAPGSLHPDSSGIEALAAAILGVSSIDFLGWGLRPPSQASNALETKMVRAMATSLTEAVNSTLRDFAKSRDSGDLVAKESERVCTPVAPPSVGEVYGVPLLSRVYAVRPLPILGRLCYAVAHVAAPAMRLCHCSQDERMRVSAKAEVVDDYGYAIPVSDRSQLRLALCERCRSPQFWSPSGFTCKNGHGGADALPYEETPSEKHLPEGGV